jgi:hypothetical protein
MDEKGVVEKEWALGVEDLGVPVKVWDEVIATDFDLPAGKALPEAFLRLMRDWMMDGGERYDYVRAYGMSDRNYVYYLLAQAYADISGYAGEDGELLRSQEDAVTQQRQNAMRAFANNDLPALVN